MSERAERVILLVGAAAFFAGFMRSAQGDYLQAFMIAGMTGIIAACLSLMIGRWPAKPVLVEA